MTPQLQMEILTPSKSEASQDDELKAPSRHESGTSKRGIIEFIPIEGIQGVCLFLFCFITFHLFRYFQDRGALTLPEFLVERLQLCKELIKGVIAIGKRY